MFKMLNAILISSKIKIFKENIWTIFVTLFFLSIFLSLSHEDC